MEPRARGARRSRRSCAATAPPRARERRRPLPPALHSPSLTLRPARDAPRRAPPSRCRRPRRRALLHEHPRPRRHPRIPRKPPTHALRLRRFMYLDSGPAIRARSTPRYPARAQSRRRRSCSESRTRSWISWPKSRYAGPLFHQSVDSDGISFIGSEDRSRA